MKTSYNVYQIEVIRRGICRNILHELELITSYETRLECLDFIEQCFKHDPDYQTSKFVIVEVFEKD